MALVSAPFVSRKGGMMDKRKMLLMMGGSERYNQFFDNFTRDDGALAGGWNGATWNIVSNAAVNTPTLGDNLLTDPGLEVWTNPTNLTNYYESIAGTSVVEQETTEIHGGSNAAKVTLDASNSSALVVQTIAALAKDSWALMSVYMKGTVAANKVARLYLGQAYTQDRSLTTDYVQLFRSYYIPTTNKDIGFMRGEAAASKTFYADDLSCKIITKSSMMATRKGYKNYNLSAEFTTIPGVCIGLIGSVDVPSNPQNYIIALIDAAGPGGTGTFNVSAIKAVNGVHTELIARAAGTYIAGSTLRIIKFDTTVYVYYKNVLVGTIQTVADADIISNEYYGMMSTYSDPSCKVENFEYRRVDSISNVLEIGDSKTVGNNAGSGIGDGDATYMLYDKNILMQAPAKVAANGWAVADGEAAIDAAIAAATTDPEFVFINFGYNDAGAGTIEATFKASMQYIIDAVNTEWGTAKIYLDKGWSSDRTAGMATINGWLVDLVAINAAKNVYIGLDETIWMEGGDAGATYTDDGVHPNEAGYRKRAILRRQLVGKP